MNKKTYNIVINSILIAITFILMYTPLGTISFGAVSTTIAHVPILIAVMILGLKSGLIIAFSFGFFSLTRAIFFPLGAIDYLFINPLISILPRMLIPVTTFLVYNSLPKKNFGIIISTIIGIFTNTIGVIGMLYLIYYSRVEILLKGSFLKVISGIVLTTTWIEVGLAVFITLPVVIALKNYFLRKI